MQVDINIEQSHQFELERVLLVYRSNRVVYVSQHGVDYDRENRPRLRAGTPLKASFLRTLARDLQGTLLPEILPETVLARTEQLLCWWTPAQRRPMFFGGTQKDLADISGHIFPQPPLLWLVREQQLYLRALTENVRPSAGTRLYFAPFWNMSESGILCQGSMRSPRVSTIASMKRWETSFYESEFTHGNVGRVTRHEGGFEGLWRSLSGKEEFPVDSLIALEETLEGYLKRIAGNHG